MAEPLVAADLDLTFDVLCDFPTEVTLDDVVAVDELADLHDFGVGQVSYFRVCLLYTSDAADDFAVVERGGGAG